MDSPKKILIASVSAGSGHVRCALALEQHLRAHYPEIKILNVDLAVHLTPFSRWLFTKYYDALTKKAGWFYGLLFKTGDAKNLSHLTKYGRWLMPISAKKINGLVDQFQPNLILTTYFLLPHLISKKNQTPIYEIITDFYPNHILFSNRVKKYFIPHRWTEQFVPEQFAGRTVISSMPLEQEFYKNKRAEEIKNRFASNQQTKIILFISHRTGKIAPEELLNKLIALNKNYQIIIIKDEKFQPAAVNLSANVILLNKTDKIDELMRAADLIVAKPGGLTVSECLYLQKPMLLYNPIAGQETYNLKFLTENNLALAIGALEQADDCLQNWPIKNWRFESPRNACEIIVEDIMKE